LKKATLVLNVFVFVLILSAHVSNEESIWEEFVTSLYNNTLTLEQIKSPYAAKEQLMEWLDIIKSRHAFDEMITPPDIHKVDNKVHHLKTQISSEDYRKLFETKWYDRAEKAGWRLKIEYKEDTCIFHFSRLKKSNSERPDLAMRAVLGVIEWNDEEEIFKRSLP